jgi:E3 ubiquitin-protein ligase TRIP12
MCPDVYGGVPHPVGSTLEKLLAAWHAHHAAGRPDAPLLVDGCPVEDLCLTFLLPG